MMYGRTAAAREKRSQEIDSRTTLHRVLGLNSSFSQPCERAAVSKCSCDIDARKIREYIELQEGVKNSWAFDPFGVLLNVLGEGAVGLERLL